MTGKLDALSRLTLIAIVQRAAAISWHGLWLEYLTAFRNIVRQYRRSLLGVAAVAVGVVCLLLAAGFIEWVFWATREGAIQNGLGHIHVVKSGFMDKGQADPMRFLLSASTPELNQVRAFPTVRTVAPRLSFNGMISRGEATVSFIGEGVDPDAEAVVSRAMNVSAGQALSSSAPNEIVLGRGLADNLGVGVGDKVVLLATTRSGSISGADCKVRGLFTSVSKAYDDSALRVPLPLAHRLLKVGANHRYILVLDDTAQTASTTLALRKQFGGSEMEFIPWYDMADFYNKTAALLSKQIGVVELIIAVIIILSISNTMMMSVMERTAEIGTCLALGRQRGQVLRQFVFEGLTVGLIGGGLGLTVGGLLALLISYVGIPMPPPPGMSEAYRGEILLTAPLVAEALLLAVGTTCLASLYPAWKASRLEVVDALRHNR
ncbi:MAG: FtsX-like permease family protein [Candidatus Accumulibacter sp.]|uniref:FtsX-like permease family protein n=1 Tax=Accumulibacter sp. TaxID=2053492 RepID=UPI002879A9CC|nr:FtsX-like permease family protein [Accumulibacter sp.]MDS4013654.1 FtsX-like permease family protein [Accumulibacter sp.]